MTTHHIIVEPNFEYAGDDLDQWIPQRTIHGFGECTAGVVGFRRHGTLLAFGTTPGPVLALTADEAEFIGRNMLVAAMAMRNEAGLPLT